MKACLVLILGIIIGSFLEGKMPVLKIGKRPMAVGVINGLLYLWIYAVHGLTIESMLAGIVTSALLVLSIVDFKTFEIPPVCDLVIGIAGLIRTILHWNYWYDYVIGFFTVSGVFLLIYFASKGNAMGGGDIKLMAVTGLFLGWQRILLSLMIGSLAGTVIHLLLMKLKGKEKVLAFGPYLAFGIFVAMLYGERIIKWYLNVFIS